MSVEGHFKIVIMGRPKSRHDISRLRNLLTSRILLVDPDASSEIRSFGELSVILTWIGVPRFMGQAQSLLHMLDKNVEKYFISWQFELEIKLIEKERE